MREWWVGDGWGRAHAWGCWARLAGTRWEVCWAGTQNIDQVVMQAQILSEKIKIFHRAMGAPISYKSIIYFSTKNWKLYNWNCNSTYLLLWGECPAGWPWPPPRLGAPPASSGSQPAWPRWKDGGPRSPVEDYSPVNHSNLFQWGPIIGSKSLWNTKQKTLTYIYVGVDLRQVLVEPADLLFIAKATVQMLPVNPNKWRQG